MMLLMDRLTDKPYWHEKVFDDTIVANWRFKALTQPEDAMYEEIIAGPLTSNESVVEHQAGISTRPERG